MCSGALRIGRPARARRLTIPAAFVLAGLLAPEAGGQSYLIRNYSEDDGLPSVEVDDVAQDPSGRMWFATRSGVAQYDGLRWTTYTVDDGLPVMDCVRIATDQGGTVWILTSAQRHPVARFDGRRWTALPDPGRRDRSLGNLTSFAVTGRGDQAAVAVGTREGLYLWFRNRWRRLAAEDGLPGDAVLALAGHRGRFFVGTDDGLAVLDPATMKLHWQRSFDPPTASVLGVAVEELAEGRVKIWLLGDDWIGTLEEGRWKLLWRGLGVPPRHHLGTIALLPDGAGGLFYSHRRTLRYLTPDATTLMPLGLANAFPAAGATGLFADREGILWLATPRGVAKLVSRRFANFRQRQGLLEDEVSALLEIAPGRLLVGHNEGFTLLTGDRAQPMPMPVEARGAGLVRVMDLCRDGQGLIWAAAQSRVARFEPDGALRWYGPADGLPFSTATLVVHPSGALWAGGFRGVRVFRDDRFQPLPTDPLPLPFVRKMVAGPDGTIYAATGQHGLYIAAGGAWRQVRTRDGPDADRLYTVYVDHRQRVWVGSIEGLYQLGDDVLERFDHPRLELRRPVYSLVEDARHRLWIGTDNGVVRWDGERARRYGVRDGLAGREANRAAALVDSAGRVWIGTNQGLSRHHEELDFEIPPPRVELAAIEVAGRDLDLTAPLRLTHRDNSPTFRFRALSFIDETAIELSHRLHDFDSEWQAPYRLESREIRYTNLPPGRYYFRLRARNAGGPWSAVVSSPEIVVAPPPLITRWAAALSWLGAGLIALSALGSWFLRRSSRRLEVRVRARTQELEEKKNELEASFRQLSEFAQRLHREVAERKRAAAGLRRATVAAEAANRAKSSFLATMSHELRTPMNGVLGMASVLLTTDLTPEQRDRVETIRESGQALVAVITDILEYSKIEAERIELAAEPVAVRACVEQVVGRFAPLAAGKELALHHRIDPEVPPWVLGDPEHLDRILTHLVDNAVKFTPRGAVEVEVGIRGSDRARIDLAFAVRDTGIGIVAEHQERLFEPFSQIDSSLPRRYGGSGLGLAICRRLVEQMGGTIRVESRAGAGSTFFFTVPTRTAPERVAERRRPGG